MTKQWFPDSSRGDAETLALPEIKAAFLFRAFGQFRLHSKVRNVPANQQVPQSVLRRDYGLN